MLSAPGLPLQVRAFNGAVRAGWKLGRKPLPLDAPALLAAARAQTGLDDFGPDTFREGLECLTQSLEDEARLSPLGRIIARQEILMALTNRQQLFDYHRRYPEIGRGAVHAPVFIIGQGRSGTTIMHELFNVDERLRIPRTWEVDHPFPPPETASYETDARIAQSDKTLARANFVLPAFKRIHRMGANLPQECVRFTTHEFTSLIFWTNYNVPTYAKWLQEEADLAPTYAYHRLFLQLLQWRHPRAPWVLKSPGHLWSLGELLDEYPDARFVQTHRDPLRMLASLTSLMTHLRKMASDEVDAQQIAREWARWNALGLNESAAFRASGRIASDRVVDVNFHDFMQAPVTELGRIYNSLGLELTDPVAARMTRYLGVHNDRQHGAHRYTFDDTGLDRDIERERVAPYQQYFSTASEV